MNMNINPKTPKTKASSGWKLQVSAGNKNIAGTFKKAVKASAGAAGGLKKAAAGSAITAFFLKFSKSGSYTLVRRFMEPLYLTRSLIRKKPVRLVINALLLALSLLLLAGTLAGKLTEARTGMPASVFGYKPVAVMSGSMEPALRTHSLTLVKMTGDIRKGDVIFFRSGGAAVLHRYYDTLDDGRIITRGDHNAEADYTPLPRSNVYGKVVLPLNFTAPAVELFLSLREKLLRAAGRSGLPTPGKGTADVLIQKADAGLLSSGTDASQENFAGDIAAGACMAVLGASRTEKGMSEEAELILLMNRIRRSRGIPVLSLFPPLSEAAKVRAREASVRWSHTRPDDSAWYTAGGGIAMAENLAKGYSTPETVCDAWMASPSHASIILEPSYRYCFVGCFTDPRGIRYWSAEFA